MKINPPQYIRYSLGTNLQFCDAGVLPCAHAVTVNVGRAGAASLDVIQEVEYVKQEAKVVYLLECLQKTPPPVR